MRDCVAEACGIERADRGGDRRLRDAHLRRAARRRSPAAFAGLAGGGLGPSGARCADAMRDHPALVGYDGAIDTELMRAEPGLVAKIGAEGVLAIGLPDGRGLALKVRDGALRAVAPAAVALARGCSGSTRPVPEALVLAPIVNSRGIRVGELRAGD